MSMRTMFEKYLAYRYQRAGAVTPGQKLEVVRAVLEDAQGGKVPIDERNMVTLDTSDLNVQAVLRGESVSMGAGVAPKRRKGGAGGQTDTRKKVLIMAGIFLATILLIALLLGGLNRSRAKAAEEEMASQITPTADLLALIGMTQTEIAMPTGTPEVPPTATLAIATPTLVSVLYAPVAGEAAQALTNPASIEAGGRLFILQQGEVDRKTGLWNPLQPEWLESTELRKVFALPRAFLEDAGIVPGGHILVRLRNGELIDFIVTTILRIPMNQIEVLSSTRPSVVILTIDEMNGGQDPTLERLVVIGEIPVPDQPREINEPKPLRASVRDGVDGAARLRVEASLTGEVIELLPVDTVLSVPYPLQRVEEDGLTWVYVHSALGSGWLAETLIIYRP
ncbi:MAG: hypothetical protein HN975_11960 [Anaerolineae bacterium]|jgi:hypothetical protein|nr:hypothetical protein [Anaerolineae bacterium]